MSDSNLEKKIFKKGTFNAASNPWLLYLSKIGSGVLKGGNRKEGRENQDFKKEESGLVG